MPDVITVKRVGIKTPKRWRIERLATVPPTVTDDVDAGFSPLSLWLDVSAGEAYVCVDASAGAAVWEQFAPGGGSGAPDDATYLVASSHAGLSAEIVVGATPGGELGGTWAAPTVDATHSGSTHAATQAAAEATAAAALSAHTGDTSDAHDATAVSIVDTGTFFTGTEVEAALQELGAAAFGGATAPSNADYLVGTASGALSAEIVVGTTPGGEMGGTWASPTVDATHAGSQHIESGTSNPAQPGYGTGRPFFRTDLGLLIYYDGTRWLTVQLFTTPLTNTQTTPAAGHPLSATTSAGYRGPVPGVHGGSDIWFERWRTTFNVEAGASALSASHKWVGTFFVDAATLLATQNIDSGSSGVWRGDAGDINALAGSTFLMYATWTKTGTPGPIYVYTEIVYRIVVA